MPVNKLITRGFGPSRGIAGRAGPITQGYGGIIAFVLAAVRRGIKVGRSSAQRRLQELEQTVLVWAKLIEFNNKEPKKKIEGSVYARVNKTRTSVFVEHVSNRAKQAWESFKVIAKIVR